MRFEPDLHEDLIDPPGPVVRYAYVRDALPEVTAELRKQRDTWGVMQVRPDLVHNQLHFQDICTALGKKIIGDGRARASNSTEAQTLAWLLHSPVTNLVIAAAEELTASALLAVTSLLHAAGTNTWLLFEERTSELREDVLEDLMLPERPISSFLIERSFFPIIDNEQPEPKPGRPLPTSDFPAFLLDLKRCSTPDQFRAAQLVYGDGIAAAHGLASSDGGITPERLYRLVSRRRQVDPSTDETKIFCRGLQAGLFAEGYITKVDFEHLLANQLCKAIDLIDDDWQNLDSIGNPRRAAIAALASSGLDATEIANLDRRSISLSTVSLPDSDVVLNETATRIVGAQRVFSQLTASRGSNHLIISKKDAATSPRTISRQAKETLGLIGRPATIPVSDASSGSGRWTYNWGWKIEPIK